MEFAAQTLRPEAQRSAEVDEFVVAFYERAIGRADFRPVRDRRGTGRPAAARRAGGRCAA